MDTRAGQSKRLASTAPGLVKPAAARGPVQAAARLWQTGLLLLGFLW